MIQTESEIKALERSWQQHVKDAYDTVTTNLSRY